MKNRYLIIIAMMVFSLFFSSCSKPSVEKPEVVEASNEEIEQQDENSSSTDESNEQCEQKQEHKYIGQALDTLEKDGIVEVYKEKNKKSEVIYRMKDLEEIELTETLPFGWFKVKLEDGSEGYVDALYVRTKEVPPHEYGIEEEGYTIVFNHEDNYLDIYKDSKLIIKSAASCGVWDHFTPRGVFEIEKGRRGRWAYIQRFETGFKYWVGFKGIYLFHSVPFDKDKKVVEEEANKLGQPASHGCIRLPVEIAEYIYNNVPEGSRVLIN